jgi:hypothetical protein
MVTSNRSSQTRAPQHVHVCDVGTVPATFALLLQLEAQGGHLLAHTCFTFSTSKLHALHQDTSVWFLFSTVLLSV